MSRDNIENLSEVQPATIPKLRHALMDFTPLSEANRVDTRNNDKDQKVQQAQQNFKDECDINNIVKRHGIGDLPVTKRMPMSGDFTGLPDYDRALNMVLEAEEAFMQLPGTIRERFANSPQRLMDFLADEKNLDEARKLGIVNAIPEKPKAPEPMLVRIAPEPDDKTKA